MITHDQLSNLVDHPVYDTDGKKIGEARHVFFDDATGKPEWVTVKTGLFGSHESFVPIRDAQVVDDHMAVPFSKNQVKDAPNVDVDAGGHLSAQEERRLYEHYGIAWDAAWERANKPGEGGWAHDGKGTGGTTGTTGTAAAAGTAGTAGAAGAAGVAKSHEGKKPAAADTAATGKAAAAAKPGTGTGTGTGTGEPGTGTGKPGTDSTRGMTGAEAGGTAMTRSEEQMHVGVERHEAGRARLRKYVVTEEQEQTVPVRHDEVRIEREPITAANRDAAMSGPDISEAEHEVTLYAEEAVVETRVTPVERVRLTTEEHVEQETVKGEVRKERIDTELDDAAHRPGKPGDMGGNSGKAHGSR